MLEYQKEFISLSIENQILTFGSFTLKSGRKSPYFYNSGKFDTGNVISKVSKCYAKAITHYFDSNSYDVIFGPAYKGITLATSLAMALSIYEGIDKPFAFNRKEIKSHGEGGTIIGSSIKGKRILLVDDVITSGKAIREILPLLFEQGALIVGILISLDRQEKSLENSQSAIMNISLELNIPVKSIIGLNDIIEYLKSQGGCNENELKQIENYRLEYGV